MAARMISANGLDMFVVEEGEGPLVLLCHGWPDLSNGWRYQLPALAGAGFHVVAPDMRGFGRTSAPMEVGAYTVLDLVGDMVALVQALGRREACIVGHDWGAVVAWHAALFRPDMFKCVAGLSVPPFARAPAAPLQVLRKGGAETFYWHYFQEPGVAEQEFERDVDRTLRTILCGRGISLLLEPGAGFLHGTTCPDELPAWLSEAELAERVDIYRRTGFRGGLHWYRNIDQNWRLTAPWQDAVIHQPSLFIAGANDGTVRGAIGEEQLRKMDGIVPNLKQKLIIEDAGHWISQERASEVNAALLSFLTQNRALFARLR